MKLLDKPIGKIISVEIRNKELIIKASTDKEFLKKIGWIKIN